MSFFMQKEVKYLLLKSDDIRPQPKKIEALNKMLAPTYRCRLKKLLGMINFYIDLWLRRSHILAPFLNKLARTKSKKDRYWTETEKTAFTETKTMLKKESLLSFPDFTKPFHVYTDASDRQPGQSHSSTRWYTPEITRKLNPAQKNYTVGERELPGIVEGLKAFSRHSQRTGCDYPHRPLEPALQQLPHPKNNLVEANGGVASQCASCGRQGK